MGTSKASAAPEGGQDQGTLVAWLAARRCPARFAVPVLHQAISGGQSAAGEACTKNTCQSVSTLGSHLIHRWQRAPCDASRETS